MENPLVPVLHIVFPMSTITTMIGEKKSCKGWNVVGLTEGKLGDHVSHYTDVIPGLEHGKTALIIPRGEYVLGGE